MWDSERSIVKAALHARLHLDISEILQVTCPSFRCRRKQSTTMTKGIWATSTAVLIAEATLQNDSMSLRLPLGIRGLLSQATHAKPVSIGFFSSGSPSRAISSVKPLAPSISALCFFSPSTLARTSPRTQFSSIRSLHGQARSPFDGLARRAFSTGRPGWIRQTYFPKRSGGYGGGGSGRGGPGWFRDFGNRLDAIPPMVMVSRCTFYEASFLTEQTAHYTGLRPDRSQRRRLSPLAVRHAVLATLP